MNSKLIIKMLFNWDQITIHWTRVIILFCVEGSSSLHFLFNTFPQSQTGEDLAPQTPATKPEEEVHYEEMNFRKRPEPSSVSVQDSRQQQETVYAQVKVSEPENSSTQTADSPEDLYAQVKKK